MDLNVTNSFHINNAAPCLGWREYLFHVIINYARLTILDFLDITPAHRSSLAPILSVSPRCYNSLLCMRDYHNNIYCTCDVSTQSGNVRPLRLAPAAQHEAEDVGHEEHDQGQDEERHPAPHQVWNRGNGWLVGWLVDWLIDWQIDRLIDQLIEILFYRFLDLLKG